MAYDLLAAVELFTGAANALLAHDEPVYVREKLQTALHRITGALYEGIRHSDQPALFDFRGTYFPSERDR
jgi:predicted lipase